LASVAGVSTNNFPFFSYDVECLSFRLRHPCSLCRLSAEPYILQSGGAQVWRDVSADAFDLG
jgi:hypothetical protein